MFCSEIKLRLSGDMASSAPLTLPPGNKYRIPMLLHGGDDGMLEGDHYIMTTASSNADDVDCDAIDYSQISPTSFRLPLQITNFMVQCSPAESPLDLTCHALSISDGVPLTASSSPKNADRGGIEPRRHFVRENFDRIITQLNFYNFKPTLLLSTSQN